MLNCFDEFADDFTFKWDLNLNTIVALVSIYSGEGS